MLPLDTCSCRRVGVAPLQSNFGKTWDCLCDEPLVAFGLVPYANNHISCSRFSFTYPHCALEAFVHTMKYSVAAHKQFGPRAKRIVAVWRGERTQAGLAVVLPGNCRLTSIPLATNHFIILSRFHLLSFIHYYTWPVWTTIAIAVLNDTRVARSTRWIEASFIVSVSLLVRDIFHMRNCHFCHWCHWDESLLSPTITVHTHWFALVTYFRRSLSSFASRRGHGIVLSTLNNRTIFPVSFVCLLISTNGEFIALIDFLNDPCIDIATIASLR